MGNFPEFLDNLRWNHELRIGDQFLEEEHWRTTYLNTLSSKTSVFPDLSPKIESVNAFFFTDTGARHHRSPMTEVWVWPEMVDTVDTCGYRVGKSGENMGKWYEMMVNCWIVRPFFDPHWSFAGNCKLCTQGSRLHPSRAGMPQMGIWDDFETIHHGKSWDIYFKFVDFIWFHGENDCETDGLVKLAMSSLMGSLHCWGHFQSRGAEWGNQGCQSDGNVRWSIVGYLEFCTFHGENEWTFHGTP